MIVQARTPTALSLAGRLGVLGLTALVLTQASTWAQKPDTPKPNAVRSNDEQLRDQVAQVFKHDPEVASLIEQIKATAEELDRSKGAVRRSADPAMIAAQRRLSKLRLEFNELWRTKSEEIRQHLIGGAEHGDKDRNGPDTTKAAEQNLRFERRLRDL